MAEGTLRNRYIMWLQKLKERESTHTPKADGCALWWMLAVVVAAGVGLYNLIWI